MHQTLYSAVREKTSPVLDQFQDYSKNWSLNPGFCFYGCKKGCYGYYNIQNSNNIITFKAQTTENQQNKNVM